jgi:hypothetical protein
MEIMAVIPELGSSGWDKIAKPMLAFLSRNPSTIEEAQAWARQDGTGAEMTRNVLAYLSLTGKAHFDDPSGKWVAGKLPGNCQFYEPSLVPRLDEPIDMGPLLRFLDSRTPRPEHSSQDPGPPTRRSPHTAYRLTLGDRTLTISQWAKETGMSISTIHGRLARGWSPERILEEPLHHVGRWPILSPPAEVKAIGIASLPQAGHEESGREKRFTRLTLDGETMLVSGWAKKLGLTPSLIRSRLRLGWPADKILRTPRQAQYRNSIARAKDHPGQAS